MSWRTVVISQNAKLDYQLGYLVVRGQETKKIHINEIGMLIVESTAVSLTAYLLSELVKHKIKVVFCDEKRHPSSELLPYYGSHDTSAKIRKQIEWTYDIKDAVWTEIVSEKIIKQAELLEYFKKPEAEMLYEYIKQMEYIISGLPYENITYDTEYDWSALFKLYNVKINTEDNPLIENIIEYIKVLSLLCKINVVAFVNLRSYLNMDNIIELYKMASYCKVSLIMLESIEREKIVDSNIVIIDKDNCVILK